tara:strand:- start:8059 stop:8469 length:411 start_codon:yes stop_codon:yes gene_type:complete
MGWLSLVRSIIGYVPQYFLKRQEQKAKEKERADKLEEARFNRAMDLIQQGKIEEAKWEQHALNNNGWKDEYMTLVLSIPMIGCFIPGLSDYILRGFQILEQTPVWYQAAIAVMIAAVYGYRAYGEWRMNQLGGGRK